MTYYSKCTRSRGSVCKADRRDNAKSSEVERMRHLCDGMLNNTPESTSLHICIILFSDISSEKFRCGTAVLGQIPTMTGFQQSKIERYRVVDLVTAINNYMGLWCANEHGCPKNAFKVLRFTWATRSPNTQKRGSSRGRLRMPQALMG
jgi:hypothetical protein